MAFLRCGRAVVLSASVLLLGCGSDSSEPKGTPTDPCADIECSGHGACVVTGSTAACDCDAGFHAVGLTCKPEASTTDAALDAVVRDVLQAHGISEDIGVGVGVVQYDQLVLARGYGVRDRVSHAPFTPDTPFAIGSTTKAFSAFLLAILAEDDLLDLEEPVRTYLPAFELSDPVASENLNAVDMLAHRSGFPTHNGLFYFTDLTRQQIYEGIGFLEDDPADVFRQSFVYNNLMYITTATLSETLTGEGWEDLLAARILEPLDMTASHADPERFLADPTRAIGYHTTATIPYYRNARAAGPAGAMVSTVRDMTKWMRMLLRSGSDESGAVLLSPAGVENLFASHNTAPNPYSPGPYGLGWHIDSADGLRLIWHGGGLDGYQAYVTMVPELDSGVVVLVNDHANHIGNELADAIYQHLMQTTGSPATQSAALHQLYVDNYLGLAQPPHTEPPSISLEGATLVNTYHHGVYGDLSTYELAVPGTYAIEFWGNVWGAELTAWPYYTAHVPIAGLLPDVPVEVLLNGSAITGLAIYWQATPSVFAFVK